MEDQDQQVLEERNSLNMEDLMEEMEEMEVQLFFNPKEI